MIKALKGKIVGNGSRYIDLVAGWITFCIGVPNPEALSLEKEIELLIYWHWNADSGPSLYGFCNNLDRDLFELLISCSGIGPKLAILLIGQLGSEQIIEAIVGSQSSVLSAVSGVGSRKAELIIAQLSSKVSELSKKIDQKENKSLASHFYQVQQVLESLNYSKGEIQKAIDFVRKESLQNSSVNQDLVQSDSFNYIMRKSLSFLSKRAS